MGDSRQTVICPICGSSGYAGDFCEQGCGRLAAPADSAAASKPCDEAVMGDSRQAVICPICGSSGYAGDFCEQGCGRLATPADSAAAGKLCDETAMREALDNLNLINPVNAPASEIPAFTPASEFKPVDSFKVDSEIKPIDSFKASSEFKPVNKVEINSDFSPISGFKTTSDFGAIPGMNQGAVSKPFANSSVSSRPASGSTGNVKLADIDESPIKVEVKFPAAFVQNFSGAVMFKLRSEGDVFEDVTLSISNGERVVATAKAPCKVGRSELEIASNITPVSQGKVALYLTLECTRCRFGTKEKYLSRPIDVTIYPNKEAAAREIVINTNTTIDASGDRAGGGLSGGVNVVTPNIDGLLKSSGADAIIDRLSLDVPFKALSFIAVDAHKSLTLMMPDGNNELHIFSSDSVLFGRQQSSCDVVLRLFDDMLNMDKAQTAMISRSQFTISGTTFGKVQIADGNAVRSDSRFGNTPSTFGTAVNGKKLPSSGSMLLSGNSHYEILVSVDARENGVMKLDLDSYNGERYGIAALHIRRNDSVPESYLIVRDAFDLGKIDSALSGYVIDPSEGRFMVQSPRGDLAPMLPHREFGAAGKTVYVRPYRQAYL